MLTWPKGIFGRQVLMSPLLKVDKGHISCKSAVGNGTTFTLHIPIIQKELTREEKTDIQKNIIHFNKKILVVEDETAISNVQQRVLTKDPCNHTVDIAATAGMAMDLFDRNTYDCVSLDYALPGETNGMAVYPHIRKTNPQAPVLFVSGNIEFLESIGALNQKDDYMDHQSKPCQNKAYVNSINRLIERTLSGKKN